MCDFKLSRYIGFPGDAIPFLKYCYFYYANKSGD